MTKVLECTAGALRDALAIAGRAADMSVRNSIAVLRSVRFQLGSVMCTDLDMQVSAEIFDAYYSSATAFLAPLKELTRFLKGVHAKALVMVRLIETEEYVARGASDGLKKLEVEFICQNVSVTFDSLPAEDFPIMAVPDCETYASLPQSVLHSIMKTVEVSVAQDANRYYLNGAYWHGVDGLLCVVSTDGHRLTRCKTHTPYAGGNAIIAAKAVSFLTAVLDAKDNRAVDCTIPAVENAVCSFYGHGWIMHTKQIDGSFPDYTRFCGKTDGGMVLFDIETLTKTIKHVASLQESKAISINPQDGLVYGAKENRICASVPFDYAEPDAVTFGVNAAYMINVLAQLKPFGQGAKLYCSDRSNPIEFRPLLQPDWGLVEIAVMPMRI